MIGKSSKEISLQEIPVVREFSDVFAEDLLGLSPDREIEFLVDMLSDIQLISTTPYRMSKAELKELQKQL